MSGVWREFPVLSDLLIMPTSPRHRELQRPVCVPMPPHTHISMTESLGDFATLWQWKPTLDFSHSTAHSYLRLLFTFRTDSILQSLEGAFWVISWICYGCVLIFSLIYHGWFNQRSMRQPKNRDLETLTYRVTKLVSSKIRKHFPNFIKKKNQKQLGILHSWFLFMSLAGLLLG